jgi:hypothetical protein
MPSQDFLTWWSRFRESGDICPIRLGMSRDELRAILGSPDDTGGTSRRHRTAAIWKYNELEFHFGSGPDDSLRLIYLERDDVVELSISSNNSAG